jgi:hypothetical protein
MSVSTPLSAIDPSLIASAGTKPSRAKRSTNARLVPYANLTKPLERYQVGFRERRFHEHGGADRQVCFETRFGLGLPLPAFQRSIASVMIA